MSGAEGLAPVLLTRNPTDAEIAFELGWDGILVSDRSQVEELRLLEGRACYVWPHHDLEWARAIETVLPRVRVLNSAFLGKYRTLTEAANTKDAIWLEIHMKRARDRTAPVGLKPPKIRYQEVDSDSLRELGWRASQPISAVPTFLPMWNAECRGRGGQTGIAHGWHVVLAGVPGLGKTMIANNLADAAMDSGEVVTFHSLEMDWDDLVLRQMAISTGANPQHLEPGKWFRKREYEDTVMRWEEKRAEKGGAMLINYDDLYKLEDIVESIRYHTQVHGSRYHIVDYLQLAWLKGRDKLEQIEEVSHAIRAVGKQLGVVTIGLSQFNRETTKNREESPENEGLMGGSPLENDASQIVLLDHSRVRWHSDGSWDGWLLLSKNRYGATIRPPRKPGIPIHFCAKSLRIRERLPDEILESETIEGRANTSRARKR